MRLHKVTHPVLGLVTWKTIQSEAARARAEQSRRICSWCFNPVDLPRRSHCGRPECDEGILRAQSWQHCSRLVLRAAKGVCALCKRQTWGSGIGPLEVDHIVPVSLGGSGDHDNLRALCPPCHKSETARLAQSKSAFVAAQTRPTLPDRVGESAAEPFDAGARGKI